MAPKHNSGGIVESAADSDQLRSVYDFWSRSYDLVAGPFERSSEFTKAYPP
jgi:hypothetical protein